MNEYNHNILIHYFCLCYYKFSYKNLSISILYSFCGVFTNLFLGFLIGVLLVGLWLSIRFYKTKLNSAYRKIDTLQSQNDVVTREQIESFIVQNLPEASIKSILDTFHLNAPQLYTILAPDKPGTLIQNQRMAKLHELRKSQKSIDEIASITGFSISYLKKL